MALNVQINGVERRGYTRWKSLRIQKDGSIETCRVEFLDHDTSATAFRPAPGDELRVDRDGVQLEYGGEVTRVTDQRLDRGDGGGTVTIVESRGWYFEASDVRIPVLTLPAQTLNESVEHLRSTYLAGKGWVNNGASTGGPLLPLLVYHDLTVAEIFDDLTKRSGWPWRVNGDREMLFQEPGSYIAPNTYTNVNSVVLRGAEWHQQRVRKATRLFITTGFVGEHVAHQEDHTADGTQTVFPINVLPPEVNATINNVAGYAAGSASIAVDGLPKSFTIPAGTTMWFAGHGGYALTADAAANVDGQATFALSVGLAQAVVDDEAFTLDAGATVRLEVNGTPTALGGAWTFNQEQAQFAKTGGAPTAGTVVRYNALISNGAVVRVWHDDAQGASGAFDYGIVRDDEVAWPEIKDVSEAASLGRSELSYRVSEPKELRLSTYTQGVWPWMLAVCSFPERLIDDVFMVQSVTLTDVGRKDQKPRVELTLLEGISAGRDWRSYWLGLGRGRPYDGGMQFIPTAYVSQSVLEVMIEPPKSAHVSQVALEVMAQPSQQTAYVSQVAIEVMIDEP